MKAGLYGPQAILGTNGVPAKGVSVTVYKHGTTTVATLWTGPTKTTKEANPTTTTATLGNLAFYTTPGLYDLSFTVGGVATKETVQVEPYYATLEELTLVAASAPMVGTRPAGLTTYQVQAGSTVVTLIAGGTYTFDLPTAFPTGILTVMLTNGTATTAALKKPPYVVLSRCSKSAIGGIVTGGSAGAYRINWLAIGF